MTLAPGTVVGDFRIEAVVGRGGMGVVYRARQLGLDRPVAVKVLEAGPPASRRRFAEEARTIAAVEHPHVVPVFAAGSLDGRPFLAMRLVDGPDLGRLIRTGRLGAARAVRLVSAVAAALDAAHARGLVHRDVKPANVLVATRGGEEHAYLSDFGIAALAGRSAPGGDGFTGTPDYTAPEIIRGEAVDARADVYALTCVLYECLAGSAPFHREDPRATLEAHLREPAPPLRRAAPGASVALAGVVARGLAKAPADRFASAGALAGAAAAALAGVPVRGDTGSEAPTRVLARPLRPLPRRVAPTTSAPVPSRRRGRHLSLVALCLLAALGVGVGVRGPWGPAAATGFGAEHTEAVAAGVGAAAMLALLALWLITARLSVMTLLLLVSLVPAAALYRYVSATPVGALMDPGAPGHTWGLALAAVSSLVLIANALRLTRRAIGDAWRARRA